MSTHWPLQSVPPAPTQVGTHTLLAQAVPGGQMLPQPPQFESSLVVSTHSPLQSMLPVPLQMLPCEARGAALQLQPAPKSVPALHRTAAAARLARETRMESP